jgi:hypothetical protein
MPTDPTEVQHLLLAAIDRIHDEVFRKNWGDNRPSPGKLIREGLSIARRCILEVSLGEPAYIEAVLKSLTLAHDRQDACGISDDGWKDEDGYILSGIGDARREAEKLRSA